VRLGCYQLGQHERDSLSAIGMGKDTGDQRLATKMTKNEFQYIIRAVIVEDEFRGQWFAGYGYELSR
jgi:hypothetical protein